MASHHHHHHHPTTQPLPQHSDEQLGKKLSAILNHGYTANPANETAHALLAPATLLRCRCTAAYDRGLCR
jgi:hypothetical protein